jgi:uncharacterized protein YhaN
MKIKDIQIDGFGVWSGLSVHSLPEGMTVFYGPNEAGKTTLMQFLRTMFYGFTAERRQRYLPPVFGGRPGGSLRVTGPGGGYEINRRTQLDDPTVIGQVAVTGSDGLTQGQHRLNSLLGNVDESIFTNVFAIGLRELQELSTLDDTTAADELYKLSSGLDRVSLVDVMRQLRSARTQLVGPTPEIGQVQGMLVRREKLRDELEQLTLQGRRWAELAAQQQIQRQEISDLRQRMEQAELESKVIETALQVRQPWVERERLKGVVKELAARTDLPDDGREQVKAIQAQLDEKRSALEELKEARRELRRKAQALPLSKGLLSLAGKIEAAAEQGPWMAALQKQIQQLETQVQNTTEQLIEDAARLGLNDEDRELLLHDKRLASLPDLSGQAISQLVGPAREVRVQATRLKQAKEHAVADKKEADRLSSQLDEFLAVRQAEDLHQAIAKQNEMIHALRRLEQVDERLDKLGKHRKELDTEAVDLASQRALPLQQAFFQHLLFVGGGSSALFGLARILNIYFIGSQSSGILYFFFGILAIIFAWFLRQFDERGLVGDIDDCESQVEALVHQIRKTEAERQEMISGLPEHAGTIEQRLKEAEYELSQLEAMLPVAHNQQAALQRYQAARKQGLASAEALKQARDQWRRTLTAMGLAESLSPKSLRMMAEGYSSLIQSRRRLKSHQDELHQRRIEFSSLIQRVEALARQVEVAKETVGDNQNSREMKREKRREIEPRGSQSRNNEVQEASLAAAVNRNPEAGNLSIQRLHEFTNLLAQHQQYLAQRKQLKAEDEELGRKHRAIQKGLDKLTRGRQTLLAELAVESPAHLDSLLEIKHKHTKLLMQIDEQEARIRAIVGGTVPYEAVQRQIEGNAGSDLEKRWASIEERLQQHKDRVSQLLQRQGEIAQEMKTLAADRRLLEVKLELATLDKQLELSAEHWRTLSVTSGLLERVCDIYEAERQPETLREASAFLKELTDGKYVRVWTPLGKNALQIDNDKHQSLPLEVLSRGTREAVFIALRLSLAAAYSRRGVMLPLVLDDVLVNFDSGRAYRAAKVLRDFAALGHQAIMFTCHEHIMRLFHGIGVQVRVLPPHGQSGEATVYTPEPSQPLPLPVVEPAAEPEVLTTPAIVVAASPSEPPVYETVLERVQLPETKPVRRSRLKPRFQDVGVDHTWYEREPLPAANDLVEDERLLAHLSSSPPWPWDSAIETFKAGIVDDFKDTSELPSSSDAVATHDGSPWWRKA